MQVFDSEQTDGDQATIVVSNAGSGKQVCCNPEKEMCWNPEKEVWYALNQDFSSVY